MPKYGMARSKWAPIVSEGAGVRPTYGTGRSVGGAVSGVFTPNFASAQHYSDNTLKNEINKFNRGSLALVVDDTDLETEAAVYGATYSANQVRHNKNDKPPFGGVAYYEDILTDSNDVIYRGYFYPKVKAVRTAENFAAQGENISFGMTDHSFTAFADNTGDYEIKEDFETEAAAADWVDDQINDGTFFKVTVAKSGDGAVSPLGTFSVAAGTNVDILVPAGVDALSDNGADVLSSVAAGKYTIADIAADHEVVAVYNAS